MNHLNQNFDYILLIEFEKKEIVIDPFFNIEIQENRWSRFLRNDLPVPFSGSLYLTSSWSIFSKISSTFPYPSIVEYIKFVYPTSFIFQDVMVKSL